ncbi:MAG: carboxypeptidase-like regulatory domain-containing protein [Saprospiraceae bacterium]|nr:carboxypeptidase-like regulatory domain-containing protein [Saprospiraceae bacterium]
MLPTQLLKLIRPLYLRFIFTTVFAVAGICGNLVVHAQNYFQLKGQLIDQKDNTPLAFAHLSLVNGRMGTTSNEDGYFILQLPSHLERDSIKVSYIGYQSKVVAISELDRGQVVIRLRRAGIELQEIVVRPSFVDPILLVKSMLRQLKRNYPQKGKNTTGFFREIIYLNTSPPTEMLYAEGVLEFYKTAYKKRVRPRDAVRIVKGVRKPLFYGYKHKEDTLSLPAISQGSHLGILVDIVKTLPDFLQPDFWQRYQFQHLGYSNLDTFSLHIVKFKPFKEKREGFFEGKLYIDANSMALVKAIFIPTRKAVERYNRLHTDRQQLPIKLNSRVLEVNYSNYQGRWYLQSGHVVNQYIDVRTKVPFINKMDMIITAIRPGKGKPIPSSQIVHKESVFAVLVDTPSPDFWDGYNVLAPLTDTLTSPILNPTENRVKAGASRKEN